MPQKVKAAVLVEPRRIELDEFPFPDVGPDDAVLRVEMAGLCGTDPKFYRGFQTVRTLPLIMGHEILGWIERVGKRFAERNAVGEGDRVVVEGPIPCGECTYCRVGSYKFCKKKRVYGCRVSSDESPYLWGAYSEYMYLAPNSIIHKIGEHVSPQAATVAAACLGNGIRWMRTVGGATTGKPVAILGVGPQGLAAVVAAKESGAYPIIVTGLARDLPRLELARELGADVCIDVEHQDAIDVVSNVTNGELADTVLDVTGSPAGIDLAVQLVKPLGTVVLAGTVPGGPPVSVPTNEIVNKEIRVQGVYGHSHESTTQAIRLAERGTYPLEKLISHEFSLDQADLAVRAMAREVDDINPIKVAIRP